MKGKEANGKYVRKILDIDKNHMQKNSNERMTLKELDRLCTV